MRILIDGYNLMYAVGLLGKRLGPDRFRKARQRFLSALARALSPVDAHQTTVVFDAATPPDEFPAVTAFQGITVVFAVGDENADARIEQLIARHPAPKSLTVVSSDHRVRQAASRRKARALSADAFLDQLESSRRPAPPAAAAEPVRERTLSAGESAYWQQVFADVEDDPATQEALQQTPALLTDADIAAIEREVEREFGR